MIVNVIYLYMCNSEIKTPKPVCLMICREQRILQIILVGIIKLIGKRHLFGNTSKPMITNIWACFAGYLYTASWKFPYKFTKICQILQ